MKRKAIILFTFMLSIDGLPSCNINQAFQLVSILNSLEHEYYGRQHYGELPITEDIQINGTVVITSKQLDVPGECLDRNDCRHYFGFSNLYEDDGVNIVSSPGIYIAYPPGTLILTNVRVRFRKLLVDTHPWFFNHVPVIQVLPPSDHECEEFETKCEHDQVCYNSILHCQYCMELTPPECVCRDEGGTFSDGTSCEFFISGDVIISGVCQDGECIPDWLFN